MERVWLFLRERYLSHRLLDSYDAIVDALCIAWNKISPQHEWRPSPATPIWTKSDSRQAGIRRPGHVQELSELFPAVYEERYKV